MSRFVAEQGKDQVLAHDDAWKKARQEVESDKTSKREENKQQDGQSLYEVLQLNKAAKQDAFEESVRLKNQIRTLDDDEVEFLDAIEESTRIKEAAVRQETAEQLELFRRQRQAAEQELLENVLSNQGTKESSRELDTWSTKKKKRRDKDIETTAASKRRKLSSSPTTIAANTSIEGKEALQELKDGLEPKIPKPAAVSLGLGAYSSEED